MTAAADLEETAAVVIPRPSGATLSGNQRYFAMRSTHRRMKAAVACGCATGSM